MVVASATRLHRLGNSGRRHTQLKFIGVYYLLYRFANVLPIVGEPSSECFAIRGELGWRYIRRKLCVNETSVVQVCWFYSAQGLRHIVTSRTVSHLYHYWRELGSLHWTSQYNPLAFSPPCLAILTSLTLRNTVLVSQHWAQWARARLDATCIEEVDVRRYKIDTLIKK